jgi:hypothetical protein
LGFELTSERLESIFEVVDEVVRHKLFDQVLRQVLEIDSFTFVLNVSDESTSIISSVSDSLDSAIG